MCTAPAVSRMLIVEDDQALSDELSERVRASGYQVTQSFDGEDAVQRAVEESFSIILLDIMLPGKDGLGVLQQLRSCRSTPVIIVSARHAEEERIRGLSAGADDYLAKPFNIQELLLRVDAIIRRTEGTAADSQQDIAIDGLVVNSCQQRVLVNGNALNFTPIELALLSMLIQNHGQVLSKPFLYQSVLNKSYSQYDRSLDMHLSRIRKKLGMAGWNGSRLQTVHGKGYCLK